MVQVVATHVVTLSWKAEFVQMHALSVGVQVFVPNALLRHSCWNLSVPFEAGGEGTRASGLTAQAGI